MSATQHFQVDDAFFFDNREYLEPGYHDVFDLPAGSSSIEISEMVPSPNALGWKF